MEKNFPVTNDRVRKTTPVQQNIEIDRRTDENIKKYRRGSTKKIKERVNDLDKEWDIERTLELNASLVALGGIVLAASMSKKWLILPAIVTAFLAQHAIQGWCPPLALFRRMKIRTRKEIDKEKYALVEALKNKRSSKH